jgi:hypothetical protein
MTLLTLEDVETRLAIRSRTTMRRRLASPSNPSGIPYFKLSDRMIRVREVDLNDWLAARAAVTAPPDPEEVGAEP